MISESLYSSDPKRMSRLGVDPANGLRAMPFQAPLLTHLHFCIEIQGIIADYLLDDQIEEIFAERVIDSLYCRIWEQCIGDHRIQYMINWNPETKPRRNNRFPDWHHQVTQLAKQVDKLLKVALKCEALMNLQEIKTRLEGLPTLALIARTELASLSIINNYFCLSQVHRGRRDAHHGVSLRDATFIKAHLFLFFDDMEPDSISAVRISAFHRLCVPVIWHGINNPDISFDKLPVLEEIPKDLPAIPDDNQQNQPAQPAAPQPPPNALQALGNAQQPQANINTAAAN